MKDFRQIILLEMIVYKKILFEDLQKLCTVVFHSYLIFLRFGELKVMAESL